MGLLDLVGLYFFWFFLLQRHLLVDGPGHLIDNLLSNLVCTLDSCHLSPGLLNLCLFGSNLASKWSYFFFQGSSPLVDFHLLGCYFPWWFLRRHFSLLNLEISNIRKVLLHLDSSCLHLRSRCFAPDNLLRFDRGVHLLLLLQKFESGQVVVQLSQLLILRRLLVYPSLIPFLHHSILSIEVIHEVIRDIASFVLRCCSELVKGPVDLSTLVFREKQNFVCTFDE